MGAVVFWTFLTVAFGAVVASFTLLAADRLGAGRSIHGRSACPACELELELRDVLPVLGYLRLRGFCRACGASIPWIHPVTELGGGLIACGVFFRLIPDPAHVVARQLLPVLVRFGAAMLVWGVLLLATRRLEPRLFRFGSLLALAGVAIAVLAVPAR